MNDDSTPGSFGDPQATSTPIFAGGGPRTLATPINALFQKSTPKNDAGFSDIVVRKPKVRFADLEDGLPDDEQEEEIPPKRYRLTPAPPTREVSLMMPDRVQSPIRTPTFPADKSKAMMTNIVSEPSMSGFLPMETISSGSDYLAKLLQESDETEESVSTLRIEDTYLTKLREDDKRREMAEPILAEKSSQAYMIKLREYRRCMLDFVKKRGEQRAIVKQAEEAVRGKITLLGETMRKVDGEVKAALERLRSVEPRR